MGSIAMDKVGNIALGYSASSSSVNPSIRYTGRIPTDPAGTLEAESTIITGGGSQLRSLNRWGDYSAMTIDPVDDCTFFYTNEYLRASGTFNWSTRIASFRFPGCGGSTQTLTSITVSPSSASVEVGGTQQFTATAYDQNGLPLSPQPVFTWSVNGGGTINQSGLFTAVTTGGFTVTASSGGVQGTANVSVTPSTAANFSLSVSPPSQTIVNGAAATYNVSINPSNGFSGGVNLALSGGPTGALVTFTPNPTATSSTLQIQTPQGHGRKTYTLTITGTSGSLTHTATTQLTVQQ
jgi:hypothetical protein